MEKQIIRLVVLTIFLLVGCSPSESKNQQPIITPTEIVAVDQIYPIGITNSEEKDSYPSPDQIGMADKSKPQPPKDAPLPENGKASISGGLFSYTAEMQVSQTQFYLTPLEGGDANNLPPIFTGPNSKIGDVSFTTDEKGNFEINNVPPGKYLLVVWAPYNWILAQKSLEDISPLILDLQADQKYPFGTINIAWP